MKKFLHLWLWLLCGLSAAILPAANPPVSRVYVDADATGANDGSSWTDAYTSLQDAIASAADTIFVAAGTYKPSTTDNQGEYFYVTTGKKIFGGFAGTEAWLTQRNIAANPTILSGDIGVPNDNSDNSDIVIRFYLTPAGTRLDGFTVSGAENGYTRGALIVNDGEVDVVNCHFENNTAYAGGALGASGATVNIDHCTFTNNYGGAGGGAIAANASVISVTHSNFLSNTGGDSGGAYFAQDPSAVTFVNCLFVGNRALNYSGAVMFANGTGTLTNCTVVNNTNREALAFPSGGGVLQNCIVWNNPNGPGYGFNASHSLIQGGWGGTGNINADPLFAGANDFHILQCSPAANTGDDALVPVGETTDLDGNPRFFSHPAAARWTWARMNCKTTRSSRSSMTYRALPPLARAGQTTPSRSPIRRWT